MTGHPKMDGAFAGAWHRGQRPSPGDDANIFADGGGWIEESMVDALHFYTQYTYIYIYYLQMCIYIYIYCIYMYRCYLYYMQGFIRC